MTDLIHIKQNQMIMKLFSDEINNTLISSTSSYPTKLNTYVTR